MRTEYIQTKVRPIKKMFIIEADDFASFKIIFEEIQDEIDLTQNLIFTNTHELWSKVTKEFVKRSRPDVILNLSNESDKKVSAHFNIRTITPCGDHLKIARFGTNLFSFSNHSWPFTDIDSFISGIVYTHTGFDLDAESLFRSINYGVAGNLKEDTTEENERPGLDATIFNKLIIVPLEKKETIEQTIWNNHSKFIHLCDNLAISSGYGRSIYEMDYNLKNHFDQGKYVFISLKTDLASICYFWNTRAYYYSQPLVWLPEELLDEYKVLLNDAMLVCMSADVEQMLKLRFPKSKIVHLHEYCFHGPVERWQIFEHSQSIHFSNQEITIHHPRSKTFSDMGMGGAFMMDIVGLRETYFAPRRNLGALFFYKGFDSDLFVEYLCKVEYGRLSKYTLDIEPFDMSDLAEVINLPSFESSIHHIFEDAGYSINRTAKSSILAELVNLIGGLTSTNIVCEKPTFELIIALTPRVRTEKVIEKLLRTSGKELEMDKILDIIGTIKDSGAVNFPTFVLTLEGIMDKGKIGKQQKRDFVDRFQELYNKRFFLRGKHFECAFCKAPVWIPLEDIERKNFCTDCGNEVAIPVYASGRQNSDCYKLNQLVARAVDQGQLSTLLLLNFFCSQQPKWLDYLSNFEISEAASVVTDVDLLIRMNSKFGIAECKSSGGFNEEQAKKLIDAGVRIQCDFVCFSCLLSNSSSEIKSFVSFIQTLDVPFPVFVFTNEVLFTTEKIRFLKYFELSHSSEFQRGPILVG